MKEIIEELDFQTRNYIGKIIDDIEPENIDDVVEAIQTDMFVGANFLLNYINEKFQNEEMNFWELKQELENIRHELSIYLLNKEN